MSDILFQEGCYYYAKDYRWSDWEIVLFHEGMFWQFKKQYSIGEGCFYEIDKTPIPLPER